MLMQPSLDFVPQDKTRLSQFGVMLQKMWRNLSLIINGQINFGDGTNRNNIDGVWSNVVTPVAPNTDFTITHNLGRIPVGYLVVEKDRAVDVYTGSVVATSSQLTLRATVASAVLRLFIVCVLLALFGVGLQAQTTSVTLQVTDAGSQSWNNGIWSVVLSSPPGVSPAGPPFNLISGGSVPNQTQSGVLSGTGGASLTLTPDASIVPSLSQWKFHVCPQATSGCFDQFVTVFGSSQTVTLTPPAISITPGANQSAYSTSEVTGAVVGAQFYLLGTGLQICSTVSGNTCTAWTSSGGASSVLSLPSSCAVGQQFILPNGASVYCGPNANQFQTSSTLTISPLSYGATFDTSVATDLVTTNNLPTVSSATATFQCPGSVYPCSNPTPGVASITLGSSAGMTLYATSQGTACAGNQQATSVQLIFGIINTVTDAHHLTISANANATSTGSCFAYGHLDDVGQQAALAVGKATQTCPKYKWPAGIGFFNQNASFPNNSNAISAACQTFGSQSGSYIGVEVEGEGRAATKIVIGPSITTSGVTGCPSSNCLMGGMNSAVYRNFSLFGVCNSTNGLTEGNSFIGIGFAEDIHDIDVQCWGTHSSNGINGIGLVGTLGTSIHDILLDGFGNLGINFIGSNPNYCHNLEFGDTPGNALIIGSGVTAVCDYLVGFFGAPLAANTAEISNLGTAILSHVTIGTNLGTNVNTGIQNQGTMFLDDSSIVSNGATTSTGFVNFGGASGVAYLHNVTATGGSAGNDFNNQSSYTLVDQGGNVPTTGRITNAGNWITQTNSFNRIAVTAAKLVLSSGWGSTAANTALSGGDFPIQFTITNSGTGQAASPTVTYTFPAPTVNAPSSCTATQIGGNNATGTFTTSALSATGATFTFSLTPTAADTEIVSINCTMP